jgi:protein O-mannosyl-transferase
MRERLKIYLVCLLLAAGTAFAYWNVDKCGFVDYDDQDYVVKNYHITSGFSTESVSWAFTSFYAANWHPLTWLSHMLDYSLYGAKPAGHHLTSLVFHILNTLLLFFLLRSLCGTFWRCAFVAALFGLHPMHVESVAWVAERKDVLSTFFMLISLLWYAQYARAGRGKNPGVKKTAFYILALLCFILALMAKPMIVTLPFIMLLLDFWPLGRFGYRPDMPTIEIAPSRKNMFMAVFVEKIPFFFLSLASCLVTVLAQHAGHAIVKANELSFLLRFENSVLSYARYIQKMFWPQYLCFFYPVSVHHHSVLKVSIALLVLILISGFAVIRVKRQPYFMTGWLWFLGTLVPVIGIVQVGSQALADRYTYIPFVGLFIVVAWGLYDLCLGKRLLKVATVFCALAALVLLALQTRVQAGFWKNDLTLADHCLMVTKENFPAYLIKGGYLLKTGDYDGSLSCYVKCLSLCPGERVPRQNIGCIYLKQGRAKEAFDLFGRLVSSDTSDLISLLNLGKAAAMLGDRATALSCFSRLVAKDPLFAPGWYNLGVVSAEMKDYEKSRGYFLQALRITPNDFDAYCALGNACFLGNRRQEAIRWYEKSISLNPWFVSAYRQLAMALDSCGNTAEGGRQAGIADSLERRLHRDPLLRLP